MGDLMDEALLSLEDFLRLPSTLTFDAIRSERLERLVEAHPEVKLGRTLGTGFVPIYINEARVEWLFQELGNSYTLVPAILSPVDAQANRAAGITQVLRHPYLDLSGRGVLIGIVDTGVDYTKEAFRYEDGSSKLVGLWDQSIEGAREEGLYYGASFDRQQINAALQQADPFALVPTRDEDGHGTFLASVAAGREGAALSGAAPGAELVVVKLRRAQQYFVDRLLLPSDQPNYFHTADVMLGIEYMLDIARARGMPLVVCLGLGSNDSGHDGNTLFEEYISYLAQRPGLAIVTAAGNESNAKHHTQGRLYRTGATERIGIRVGVREASFVVNIFSAAYDKISIGIVSPMGEVISRVPFNLDVTTRETLVFEKSSITVTYYRTSNTVITIGFRAAKEGVWELVLYGDSILSGEYHAWLPITYQVNPEVDFLRPVSEYTIVYPANALRSITCGAYNSANDALYVASSWGPTRLPRAAPDFVAPGVSVQGIYPTGVGEMTGTSVAAAMTSGAAALLFEWGLVQENLPAMDGDLVRRLLIAGCRREAGERYPSVQWGYGKLDLYQTFWGIRESGEGILAMERS